MKKEYITPSVNTHPIQQRLMEYGSVHNGAPTNKFDAKIFCGPDYSEDDQ